MVKGKKRALLVGCHYYDTFYEKEHGCGNDLQIIQDLLMNSLNFEQGNIKTLMEIKSNDMRDQPTKKNIKEELEKLINKAEEGDVLFFYFSGLVQLDETSNSPAIMSCKLERFTDFEFGSVVNKPLPPGASLTFACQASYGEYFYQRPVPPGHNKILHAACRGNEKPARHIEEGNTYGHFTKAIQRAVEDHSNEVTNRQLNTYITGSIEMYGNHPRLFCTSYSEQQPFLRFSIIDAATSGGPGPASTPA